MTRFRGCPWLVVTMLLASCGAPSSTQEIPEPSLSTATAIEEPTASPAPSEAPAPEPASGAGLGLLDLERWDEWCKTEVNPFLVNTLENGRSEYTCVIDEVAVIITTEPEGAHEAVVQAFMGADWTAGSVSADAGAAMAEWWHAMDDYQPAAALWLADQFSAYADITADRPREVREFTNRAGQTVTAGFFTATGADGDRYFMTWFLEVPGT